MAPAELGRYGQSTRQVAHEGFAGDKELIGQRVPRAHRQAAGGGQGPQPILGLGPHGQIVLHHGHLAVEEEVGVGRVGFELG